jgi:hypothetical protein
MDYGPMLPLGDTLIAPNQLVICAMAGLCKGVMLTINDAASRDQ